MKNSWMERLAGGFFIVMPVVLAGLLVNRAFLTLKTLLQPVLDALPGVVFQSPNVRFALVTVILALLLVLIGAIARTPAGRRMGRGLEAGFLNRLPLYPLMRNLASGLEGRRDGCSLKGVLVTTRPGVAQLAFLVETHPDGRATVFLPSAPNPASGTVMVVDAELVRELPVPAHRILQSLGRWGDGTAALIATPHPAPPH